MPAPRPVPSRRPLHFLSNHSSCRRGRPPLAAPHRGAPRRSPGPGRAGRRRARRGGGGSLCLPPPAPPESRDACGDFPAPGAVSCPTRGSMHLSLPSTRPFRPEAYPWVCLSEPALRCRFGTSAATGRPCRRLQAAPEPGGFVL